MLNVFKPLKLNVYVSKQNTGGLKRVGIEVGGPDLNFNSVKGTFIGRRYISKLNSSFSRLDSEGNVSTFRSNSAK